MIFNVRIVGPAACGKDNEGSDIDFRADTRSGSTLFDIGFLHEDLEDLLAVPVDIIINPIWEGDYAPFMELKRQKATPGLPRRMRFKKFSKPWKKRWRKRPIGFRKSGPDKRWNHHPGRNLFDPKLNL